VGVEAAFGGPNRKKTTSEHRKEKKSGKEKQSRVFVLGKVGGSIQAFFLTLLSFDKSHSRLIASREFRKVIQNWTWYIKLSIERQIDAGDVKPKLKNYLADQA